MEKTLGVAWVWNPRDGLLCSWALLRADLPSGRRLPKDMRRYIKRYMYDPICAATPIFNRLDSWTGAQQCVYRTLLAQSASTIPFQGEKEASSVLAGIAVALALCGKRVALISCSLGRIRTYSQAFDKYICLHGPAMIRHQDGVIEYSNGGYIHWHTYDRALKTVDCYLFDYCSNDRRLFPDILQPHLIIYSS